LNDQNDDIEIQITVTVYNQAMHRNRLVNAWFLAILLVFSQAALAAHSTQHASLNLDHCQLCIGQAQPVDSAVTHDQHFPMVIHSVVTRQLPDARPVIEYFVATRNQRAPPVFS
jgi:hypothetical protein